jgi:hypothetical protein
MIDNNNIQGSDGRGGHRLACPESSGQPLARNAPVALRPAAVPGYPVDAIKTASRSTVYTTFAHTSSAAPLSPTQADEAVTPGRRPVPARIIRWINDGVLVAGRRVRLAATRVGGRWQIRPCDLEAFIVACNCGRRPVERMDATACSVALARRAERAQRERRRMTQDYLVAEGLMSEGRRGGGAEGRKDEGRGTRGEGKATA